jgi:nucleoside-diphosphate-sugar epimerase
VGVRRRAPLRGYGEASADFAFTESPYSASKITSEAFIYSYARCYGLQYLVFRFSNVYGRYDNDLERMSRVLPLWTHKLMRGEPITVYGEHKTLDFTYVDDCVDGIRAASSLAEGSVSNGTINPAYGQGNRLLHAAELIAKEPESSPHHDRSSLLGEVTHYVADVTRARERSATSRACRSTGNRALGLVVSEWRAEHPERSRSWRILIAPDGHSAWLKEPAGAGTYPSPRASARPPPGRRASRASCATAWEPR